MGLSRNAANMRARPKSTSRFVTNATFRGGGDRLVLQDEICDLADRGGRKIELRRAKIPDGGPIRPRGSTPGCARGLDRIGDVQHTGAGHDDEAGFRLESNRNGHASRRLEPIVSSTSDRANRTERIGLSRANVRQETDRNPRLPLGSIPVRSKPRVARSAHAAWVEPPRHAAASSPSSCVVSSQPRQASVIESP